MADNDTHWSEQSIQPDFQQAASPEQEQTRQQEEQEQGSEMVRRSQPVPGMHPDWAQEVDRQSFNRQWEAEQQRVAWLQEQAQEYQQRKAERGQAVPERSINDDFNFKADELGKAKFDVESAQERLETLKGYARPVNKAEKAMDVDHECQQQSLTEKFQQLRGRVHEDDLDLDR